MATPRRLCRFCQERHRKATEFEERFAGEYSIDLDAGRAYGATGYTGNYSAKMAYRLLQRPPVQCLVRKLKAAQLERTQVDADLVLHSLLKIARLDPAELFNPDGTARALKDVPEDVRRAIAGLEYIRIPGEKAVIGKVRLPDKVKCWELLGKHLKLFTEVHRLEGVVDVRAQIAGGRRRVRFDDRVLEGDPERIPGLVSEQAVKLLAAGNGENHAEEVDDG